MLGVGGIVQRSVDRLFEGLSRGAGGRRSTVAVSVCEIYNESVNDLLEVGRTNLKLFDDGAGGTKVQGLVSVEVSSASEAMAQVAMAAGRRAVGSTNIHAESSRSHTIVMIRVDTEVAGPPAHSLGSTLYLVDLAGSERQSATGAKGTRLHESKYINKSLLTLSNVIGRLAEESDNLGAGNSSLNASASASASSPREAAHVPYRDSKLTRLLRTCLGGNALTVMICCLSPAVSSIDESLSTLHFAQRASRVRVHAVENIAAPAALNPADYDDLVRRLQEEMSRTQALESVLAEEVEKRLVAERELAQLPSHPLSSAALNLSVDSAVSEEGQVKVARLREILLHQTPGAAGAGGAGAWDVASGGGGGGGGGSSHQLALEAQLAAAQHTIASYEKQLEEARSGSPALARRVAELEGMVTRMEADLALVSNQLENEIVDLQRLGESSDFLSDSFGSGPSSPATPTTPGTRRTRGAASVKVTQLQESLSGMKAHLRGLTSPAAFSAAAGRVSAAEIDLSTRLAHAFDQIVSLEGTVDSLRLKLAGSEDARADLVHAINAREQAAAEARAAHAAELTKTIELAAKLDEAVRERNALVGELDQLREALAASEAKTKELEKTIASVRKESAEALAAKDAVLQARESALQAREISDPLSSKRASRANSVDGPKTPALAPVPVVSIVPEIVSARGSVESSGGAMLTTATSTPTPQPAVAYVYQPLTQAEVSQQQQQQPVQVPVQMQMQMQMQPLSARSVGSVVKQSPAFPGASWQLSPRDSSGFSLGGAAVVIYHPVPPGGMGLSPRQYLSPVVNTSVQHNSSLNSVGSSSSLHHHYFSPTAYSPTSYIGMPPPSHHHHHPHHPHHHFHRHQPAFQPAFHPR
jgi:hypothetical protein